VLVAHLHDQCELFPGAVELGADELFEGVGIERDIFSHAAVLHDEVQTRAVDASRGHTVYGTGPEQPNTVPGEPALFIPVLDVEMVLVRFCKPGEVEVAAVLGLRMKAFC
jgi:hypothetical protein